MGIGAGVLSPAAAARLSRGVGDPPVADPDFADHDAVARWRRDIHAAWGEGTEPGEAAHEPTTLVGRPALRAGPAPRGAPTVLYLRGGGYLLGSAGVAAPITARLAAPGPTALTVVSLDYRLAPEHPYPAALDDSFAAYRALVARGDGPVAVAGDSAGGALAVGVALRAAAAGVPAPASLVLLCPHLAHRTNSRTAVLHTDAPDTDVPYTDDDRTDSRASAAYLGATSAEDPLVSPLQASGELLAALPPLLVQAGTLDALHHQSVRFVRRARAAGADATLDLWDGLWHTWQYHRRLPEADLALHEAQQFLHRACARAQE